ncbi:MAG: nucleotide-binding protein [Sphaerochaeta sp.]
MKRLSLFCGHYGSGKTNLAVNYALYLRKLGLEVTIADLDIVNPYFRSKDSFETLEAEGVKVIALPFANSSVDLPALPSGAYALVQDKSRYAVLDIGGDDRGAYALGRFVPYILEENNYDMFYVVNFYRPLTSNAKEAMEVMREIEGACGLEFTGIINNSNLGAETTAEKIRFTFPEAERLCGLSGLPLTAVTAEESAAEGAMVKIKLQKRPFEV